MAIQRDPLSSRKKGRGSVDGTPAGWAGPGKLVRTSPVKIAIKGKIKKGR